LDKAFAFGVDRRSAGQPVDSRDRRLCLEPQVGTYRRLFEASRVPFFLSESFRRDFVGGVVSSAVAIPLAIGFGMFAFVSLGDQYFAWGAVSGLISALVVSVVSVLLGERSTMVYAPRVTTTFFLGLLLNSLLHSDALRTPSVSAVLAVFFAIVLAGGVFQALFGLMRLGTLIKFTPHPVMAGFQNMAAALLFLVQIGNVLGLDHSIAFTRAFGSLGSARPLSVLVAVLTFATMWHARKLTTIVPPLLVGLGCGAAAYYLLLLAGFGAALGPVIGVPTASATMNNVLADFSSRSIAELLAHSAPVILTSALALAIIASIDALLCLKLASQPGVLDIGGDGLLVRLGLANAGSAGFGGITGGINIGASVTNRAFGGHSRVSVVVNAAMLLAALTLLFPLVAYIPRVALSGVIMVVAVQHIDPWTKQTVRRLMKPNAPRRATIALDLAVAMFVSVVSIALNVVLAVFIGVALAVFLFVVRMSRSNIRRLYRCDVVRSRKSRDAGEMALLEAKGASILVVELQGALFFGTAERLAHAINAETSIPTSGVILGLRRVTEIDSTGARIVADIDAALSRRNIKLVLVRSDEAEPVARLSDVANLTSRIFPDLDRAIEWAEDDLLEKHASVCAAELPLESISILRDFTASQIGLLASHLERVDWPADHVVFKQGDPGSDLFLVTRGHASVYLTTEAGTVRLATFAAGSVFGELAILDHGPRSATVTADQPMAAFRLSTKAFAALCELDPHVAIKLVSALARELSDRLRRANLTIRQLEL
jgi:sulfate permease, SulP family